LTEKCLYRLNQKLLLVGKRYIKI